MPPCEGHRVDHECAQAFVTQEEASSKPNECYFDIIKTGTFINKQEPSLSSELFIYL